KEIYHNNNNNVIKDLITDTTLSLVNMETGQRGYLLSGKEISLEPYIKGEKELSQNFTRLLELTIKTPQMKNDILLIKEAVESWKTKVANVEIDARRVMNQYKYSIDDISKTMRNGKGKFYIDAIRTKVDEIIAVEKSLMDTRFEEQESSASFAANFTIFGTALALIIGAIIAIIISKNIFQAIKENQKKDQLLLQQSKLAAMGEMVGAIAHQWRQPLNALALRNQFIIDDFEDDMIDKEYIEEFSTSSMKLINFMSKTIDDFRNFFRLDKLEKEFSIHEKISETSNMLLSQLTDHQIEINIDKNDFRVMGHDSEFQQVILNLINNAKDALLDNNISSPQINVEVSQEKDMGIIKISDNAGGIPEDVIPRVFEPYFTTKEEGKGTGLGLYMSKMIIEDNMGGHIQVENSKDGAVFTIKLSNLIASNTK
ncbi:MAG: CHASE3 domain-containing protein, partial [Campylobacteraceae bacterium]|nr:CHASE3 domain-containing protein [Campylobacteraceae bacterium]